MAFNTEELENLSALMLATNDDSTRLAFEILDAQPETEFPEELITEIFVVYKMSNHKDYQAKAKKILDKVGSPALHKSMARKFDLGQGSAVEPTIEKSIIKFINGTELVGVKFARALYNKYGSGILYLLNYLPYQEFKAFFAKFINGTSFSLTHKELNTLPDLFYEYVRLTEIDLSNNKLGTIYKEFKAFANLKVLRMHANLLKNIPKDIAKLTKLEVLDISSNSFTKFPDVISELHNLRELNLARCCAYNVDTVALPANFYQLKNLRKLTLSDWDTGNHPFENYPLFSSIESDSEDKPLDVNPLPAALQAWRQHRQGIGYLLRNGDSAIIQEIIQHFYDAETKTLDWQRQIVYYLPKELADWDIRHLNMRGIFLGNMNGYWWSKRPLDQVLRSLMYMPNLESLDLVGGVFKQIPPALLQLQHLKLLNVSISRFESSLLETLQHQLPNCEIKNEH